MAKQIGLLIGAFEPGDLERLPRLTDMLRRYSEALTPWAEQTAGRMIQQVNIADEAAWRQMGEQLSAGVQREILRAPTGETMRELMAQQVRLIKSLPIEAGQRVHDLTFKALEDSSRAKEIAAEIKRSGQVTASRAMLIARTEVSRTAANLTQARAQHVGSDGYVWETSRDGDVRPSHKAMSGKFVAWNNPPTLDGLTGHAGCLPNCRCWARVIIHD